MPCRTVYCTSACVSFQAKKHLLAFGKTVEAAAASPSMPTGLAAESLLA